MDEILIRPLRREERGQAAPLLFRSQQAALRQDGLVLAAFCGDKVCGAAGALPADGALRLVSLFVDEPYRRQGVAAALLREVEAQARAMGLPQVTAAYSCAPDQATGLHRLFLRQGYLLPEAGETLYRLPLAGLQGGYFASLPAPSAETMAHILPVRSLPAQAAAAYAQLCQTEALSFLSMQNAPGKVLPSLCLAYVHDQQLCAVLTVCDADSCLHISGAYVAQATWGKALIALLQTALRTAQQKYPQYDTVTVTAANIAGGRLISRLLAGTSPVLQTAYQTSKLVQPVKEPVPAGYDGVLARFNTLTQELAARGVASRLVMTEGALPYLELDVAEGGQPATLYYQVQGGEDYEGFRLSAVVEFPTGDMDAAQQEALCARMDETGSAGTFVPEAQPDCIRLCNVLLEAPAFDYPKVIDEFILPFLAQAARCAALANG